MELRVRKSFTIVEDKMIESGEDASTPLRKVAGVLVVENPYVGRYVEDLQPLINASEEMGHRIAKLIVEALGPYEAQSYGKAGLVGMSGEQEHANAMLTTVFANPLRDMVGGGKSCIPSFTKRAAPGTTIDIPLACKDALYVRSHYDGMTLTLPDTPGPDEIALIFCVANRGRINARVGGLKYDDMVGEDGLV